MKHSKDDEDMSKDTGSGLKALAINNLEMNDHNIIRIHESILTQMNQ